MDPGPGFDSYKERMLNLQKTGKHSDLTIVAGDQTFHVHSWVLWPHSNFFETAIHGRFKEAFEKLIDLSDDKPEMVSRMLDFCYTFDYSDGWAGKIEVDYVSAAHLNAKMYVLAEKYAMDGLQKVATAKLRGHIDKYIAYTGAACLSKFASLAAFVYDNTRPSSDRALRDLIVTYTLKSWKLLFQDEEFRMVFVETPDLIEDIFNGKYSTDERIDEYRRSRGLRSPNPKYKRICTNCHEKMLWRISQVACVCGHREKLNEDDGEEDGQKHSS